MPLSREHVQFLAGVEADHEGRISSLKRGIEQLEDEIQVHRTLIALAQSVSLQNSLNELADVPSALDEASRDALSFFRERGVEFPTRTELHVSREESSGTVSVEGKFIQGYLHYTASWHSVNGFAVVPTQV